jgi:hypothetical protein
MSVETRKVLDMLAEGKINAEQADKLLDKLSALGEHDAKGDEALPSSSDASCSCTPPSKARFLRIVVDKPGHDQVNVRIPLAFARSGSRLLAVLPTRVREKLADQGIDFAAIGSLNAEDWSNAVENMNIDIANGNGKTVKVFCE